MGIADNFPSASSGTSEKHLTVELSFDIDNNPYHSHIEDGKD